MAKKTGCLSQIPVVCEVAVNDELVTQFLKLIMPVTVYMRERRDLSYILCTSEDILLFTYLQKTWP